MKLPWTYWPIMAVALVFVMVIGALIGATIGVNPYTAAFVAGGLLVLWETYSLRRRGY